MFQEHDERGTLRVLASAQLLSDGEELTLHLRAVEQQHRSRDKGTVVRLGQPGLDAGGT